MVSEPQEWGGWFGTLLLIVLSPVIMILPQLMCIKDECILGYPKILTDVTLYVDLRIFTAYLVLFLFVIIFSTIPIGRKIDGPQNRVGRLQYRLNGGYSIFKLLILKKNYMNEIIILHSSFRFFMQPFISNHICCVYI